MKVVDVDGCLERGFIFEDNDDEDDDDDEEENEDDADRCFLVDDKIPTSEPQSSSGTSCFTALTALLFEAADEASGRL